MFISSISLTRHRVPLADPGRRGSLGREGLCGHGRGGRLQRVTLALCFSRGELECVAQVVELLSSPQASEGRFAASAALAFASTLSNHFDRRCAGEAGDFVLIRKENGIEGWTPAKHLKPMLALG